MKTGIIYCATSPSGKVYIGKTIQTLHRRKSQHYSCAFNKNSRTYDCIISKAIRKYGNDIVWEILHFDISKNELNKLEIEEIKKYGSFGGGGSVGCKHSLKTRQKMSATRTGRKRSLETCNKISTAHIGKKASLEARQKMSASQTGKKLSQETRQKLSVAQTGRKYSIATRQKMSKNNKKAKLNLKIAEEIRIKYAINNYTRKELAKEYKVNKSTIVKIINYTCYKSYPTED